MGAIFPWIKWRTVRDQKAAGSNPATSTARKPRKRKASGALLFTRNLWKSCGKCGKLGEKSARRRPEPLRDKGSRLGEMGEKLIILITIIIIVFPGN